jgi:hypothetical protein
MPGRYPFSAYAAPARRSPAGFGQDYCSVTPATASGHLKKGAGYWPCRVEVTGECVTLAVQARNRIIEAVPVALVQFAAPGRVPRIGTGTVILMNGRPWLIDFTRAGQREQTRDGLPGLFRSVRRARILNRAFTSAILTAAATPRPPAPSEYRPAALPSTQVPE